MLLSALFRQSAPHFRAFVLTSIFSANLTLEKPAGLCSPFFSEEILLHNKFEQYFGRKQENQYCNCMLREMDIIISAPLYAVKEKVSVRFFDRKYLFTQNCTDPMTSADYVFLYS